MSIIKISKESRDRYTIVSNTVLRMKDLSWKAKGLWAYLMSCKEDWDPNVKHIAREFEGGVKMIYSTLNELIDANLCCRYQECDENGKWGKMIYQVFEEPVSIEELKKFLPHRQNRHAVKRSAENGDTKERTTSRKTNPKEKREREARETFGEFVELSKHEHEQLIERFGKEKTEYACKVLNEWKLDTPKSKWKKSDYRSILRWVMDRVEEDIKKNKFKPKGGKTEKELLIEKNKKFVWEYVRPVKFDGNRYMKAHDSGLMICQEGERFIVSLTEENFCRIVSTKLLSWGFKAPKID